MYTKSYSPKCISDIHINGIHGISWQHNNKTSMWKNSKAFLKCNQSFWPKNKNGTRLFSISQLLLNRTQRFTDWTKTEQFRNNAKENFSTGLISDQTIWLQPVCQNCGKKTLLLTTTLNSVNMIIITVFVLISVLVW